MKKVTPQNITFNNIVSSELTTILFNNALRSNLVALATTTIVLSLFWDKLPPQLSVLWSVSLCLSACYRLKLLHTYRKSSPNPAESKVFNTQYIRATFFMALCWMVIITVGLLMKEFEHRIFFTLLLVALLGASVPALSASLSAIYIYILVPSIPAIPLLIFHGGSDSGIGIALIIYIFMMLKSGQHVYSTLVDSIRYRLDVENLNLDLERMVSDRTKDLEYARDEAERANKIKTTFLANMSHEIRTPLNIIINLSKLALTEEMSAKSRKFVSTVERSGNTLLAIINDILELTKIESGGFPINREPFNLEQLLENLHEDFDHLAKENDCSLQVIYTSEHPPFFIGDPLRIHQILSNIIGNAIKFTHEGNVTIHIKENERNDDHVELEISVRDTGIGISSHQLEELFQPFKQLDDSTTRKYGGSGLGLVISKQLTELMGGTITVESNQGEGSTFTIYLPLLRSTELIINAEALEHKIKDSSGELHALQGKTALIVDDIPTNQMIMQNILMNIKINSILAENGADAITKLQEYTIDIIFMDIHMPVMDGYEATENIRDLPDFATLPIVAMTANAMSDDIQKCYDHGMNYCLTKPIKIDELNEILLNYL